MIKKHIPNFLTCCNLACGCVGIVMAFEGQLIWTVYLIWTAMVFDFFDGLAARALKISSPMGKELDSLADMVSFGVVPAVIMYQLIGPEEKIALVAFTVAIFSALRLAKFNIDERQTVDFIGLPTPANALFLSSLVFVKENQVLASFFTPHSLAFVAVLFSLMLVMPVRLFSLKIKNLNWVDNKYRMIFIALSALLLVSFGIAGLPLVILLYIILSIAKNLFENSRQQ